MPCDDCSRTENCPPCVNDPECPEGNGPHCFDHGPDCCHCGKSAEEPPLTPEEEEELSEGEGPPCSEVEGCDGGCCAKAPPPPQPAGRPPFAVNYSVQGHLYQVAVPGDATVKAVDGALVIQHYLGPVAGIVQVLPIISEEAPRGAEADQ